MGRASNRKKARRQVRHGVRRARQGLLRARQDTADQFVRQRILAELQALAELGRERAASRAAARRAWCGGGNPRPATAPGWPEDSVGGRFLAGPDIAEARTAPQLLAADIPDPALIAADPAHWAVAMSVLVRAVVFDGLPAGHPAVRALADVLAPVVAAELKYREAQQDWLDREPHGPADDDEVPDFASMDGPLFLLGTCVLSDAVWALVGDDPLADVLPTLARSLDGIIAGVAGETIAGLLIASFATEYRCELPGDADVLAGLDGSATGSPLEDILAVGLAAQDDILQIGLAVLAVLAQLCTSGSRSAVRQAA